ncbi:MAG: NYN domain-containing protein [Elusimicrobia bacterium]|nr:NYN domain-containing protein [Elusimicrobiota bacterium]
MIPGKFDPTALFGRVMIFIDGNYLFESCKQAGYAAQKTDFVSFFGKLTRDNRYLVRAYFYDSYVGSEKDPRWQLHQRFRELNHCETHLGGGHNAGGKQIQKGVDVKLAIDLVRHAANSNYDVAILCSGDADFIPAVRVVKGFGKQVELFYFNGRTANELIEACDVRIQCEKGFGFNAA